MHVNFSDTQLLATYGPMLDNLFQHATPDVIRARIDSYLGSYLGNRESLRAQSRARTKQPVTLSPALQNTIDRISAKFGAGLEASLDRFRQRAVTPAIVPPFGDQPDDGLFIWLDSPLDAAVNRL